MLRTAICRQRCLSNQKSYLRDFSTTFLRRGEAAAATPGFADKVARPSIKNQVLFFALGSGFIFSYAAFRTNFDTERVKSRAIEAGSLTASESSSSANLRRYLQQDLVKDLRGGYTYIARDAQWIPNFIRPYLAHAYVSVLQPYADAGSGKRLCWKICLLNAGVYFAWKVSSIQPAMLRSFMHHPLSGLSYTMITSVFSHRAIWHLGLNCLALEGFGSAASTYLMREHNTTNGRAESSNAWHFLAFFLSAGAFASLVSHIASVKVRYPRLIKQLSSPAAAPAKVETWSSALATSASTTTISKASLAAKEILPSLGASGAVYACVTMTALAFPDSKIALAIPPSYPINIQWGVGGMVALDVLGIIRGWRYFDHYAHFGGALFGVAYYYAGSKIWNSLRNTIPPAPQGAT